MIHLFVIQVLKSSKRHLTYVSFNDFFFSRALLKDLAAGMHIASVSINHTTGKVNKQNKTTPKTSKKKHLPYQIGRQSLVL